jgi:hypothetical protein
VGKQGKLHCASPNLFNIFNHHSLPPRRASGRAEARFPPLILRRNFRRALPFDAKAILPEPFRSLSAGRRLLRKISARFFIFSTSVSG